MMLHSVSWAWLSRLRSTSTQVFISNNSCTSKVKLETRQTRLILSTSSIAVSLTFPETILGAAGHVPEVPHAACACGLSPDGLG